MLSRGQNVLDKSLAGLRCAEVMPKKKQGFTKVQNTFKKTIQANLKTQCTAVSFSKNSVLANSNQ